MRLSEETRSDVELATEKMNKAGYTNITPDMVEKSKNKRISVFIAVVDEGMVVYTPRYDREPVKFIPFG